MDFIEEKIQEFIESDKDYDSTYQEEMAAVYDFHYNNFIDDDWFGGQEEIVKNNIPENSCVLELACGTGKLIERIREDYAVVDGVDYSKSMVGIARNRCSDSNFYNSSFTDLSGIEKSYDAFVMLGNPINHYPALIIREILEEISEISSKNAVFVYDFFPESLREWDENIRIDESENENFRIVRSIFKRKEINVMNQYHCEESEYLYKVKNKKTGDTSQESVKEQLYSHPTKTHKRIASEYGKISNIEKYKDNRKVLRLEF